MAHGYKHKKCAGATSTFLEVIIVITANESHALSFFKSLAGSTVYQPFRTSHMGK